MQFGCGQGTLQDCSDEAQRAERLRHPHALRADIGLRPATARITLHACYRLSPDRDELSKLRVKELQAELGSGTYGGSRSSRRKN